MPNRRLIPKLVPAYLAAFAAGAAVMWWVGGAPAAGAYAVIVLVLAAATVVVYRTQIAEPLGQLRQGARHFAAGSLEQELRVSDTEEIGSVAIAMNQMGRELAEKIRTVTAQAREREAILASMAEGVIAIDSERTVISMNNAAADLFSVDASAVTGEGVERLIRHADLLRFLGRALSADEPVRTEFTLPAGAERKVILAHSTALVDADGRSVGAVVVFNDITRLRQLEQMRQEFVANVSHELKTPISAIKAAVETVIESDADALPAGGDRRESDKAASRFLPMILRQADRLNAIVEDLLALARLEQETSDEDALALAEQPVLPVLRAAAETCQANAEAREIPIAIEASPQLSAMLNDRLLGQAIVNLLDNAIKYSPPGRPIRVQVERVDGELVISVIDRGVGIEPEHLPRLFERFYRTDKARSRAMGGTGLGLAIVKHVAQTHHGRVSVESTPGSGSTFRLHLPAPPRPAAPKSA